jgi:RNA polymerase sigma-70 factor (ECF subfamily)
MRGKLKMIIPRINNIRWANKDATNSAEAEAALEAAFDEHWSSVCETLYYLVGDWDEAQDLALETFWRLHTRPPRDLTNLRGWLHTVATNIGLNAIRARRRRQRYEEAAGALRLQRSDPLDPEDVVEHREMQDQVRRVLSKMNPRKAQILILRHTGHTYADIADILDVAPGSVGTMLARAEKDFERRYRMWEDVR